MLFFILFPLTEDVVADGHCYGEGAYPLVGRGFGVVVIDAASRGVPSVKGVPCRVVSRVCHGDVKLPVIKGGKGSALIKDSRDGVGEGGVPHPVQDDCPHGNLSHVGLAPRFRRDHSRKEVKIALGYACGGA